MQAAARLDPDGREPVEAKQRERGLTLVDRPDGRAKISGRLTPHAAAALRAVLGPLAAPAPTTGSNGESIRDERTAAQRRHDALADACIRLLRTGSLPDTGGAATTILVTIDYRDLLHRYWYHTNACSKNSSDTGANSGTGFSTDSSGTHADAGSGFGSGFGTGPGSGRGGADGFGGASGGHAVTSYGTLIPVDELLRRAGDAHIIPVVLTDTGGVMANGGPPTNEGVAGGGGRDRRLASPGQRRALAARDGGCVRPGCTIPADWCEVHHLIPWQYGGRTDLDELALVCPHDHDELDRDATLTMIDGIPHWTEPPHLDPTRTPRRNTAHHIPRILTQSIAAAAASDP